MRASLPINKVIQVCDLVQTVKLDYADAALLLTLQHCVLGYDELVLVGVQEDALDVVALGTVVQ